MGCQVRSSPPRPWAALVLCGGRSRRMGRDKASLPFGNETLLERVVRVVSQVADEVVVVAREGQSIPGGFRCVRDPAEGLGPLAGLAAGLAEIGAERAFVTACDAPLLRPAFVRRLLELSVGFDCAVPEVDSHLMVTSAVYARVLGPRARALLDAGERRPRALVELAHARRVLASDLVDCDPELESLLNCNSPDDYVQALRRVGLFAGDAGVGGPPESDASDPDARGSR